MEQHYRTDLALENCEQLQDDDALAGVDVRVEEDEENEITVTWVEITNEEGAASMGKPVGNYITLECAAMQASEPEVHEAISRALASKLAQLHPLKDDATILVVGLGNWQVTPDALGPQVCEKMLVTRHLGEVIPEELHGRVRAVSALRPGVMGITGIETAEILLGVAQRIKPDVIIAVDALAARRTSRINTTIQISDTGINPGAGLGNKRTPINRASMGVHCIGIGVPTVVDAATLVSDAMRNVLDDLNEHERDTLIRENIAPELEGLFVTPKTIDAVIARLATIIANALNQALHPGVTAADVHRYLS